MSAKRKRPQLTIVHSAEDAFVTDHLTPEKYAYVKKESNPAMYEACLLVRSISLGIKWRRYGKLGETLTAIYRSLIPVRVFIYKLFR